MTPFCSIRRQRLSSEINKSKSATVHLICIIIVYMTYKMIEGVASELIFVRYLSRMGLLLLVTYRGQPVALLPLVEMGTAPPIAPEYDMLRPMNRFTRRHAELDNCSYPCAEHSRAMALI